MHDFDRLTQFCLKCGCSRCAAVEGRQCSPANVLPISHMLSNRFWDRTIPADWLSLDEGDIPR